MHPIASEDEWQVATPKSVGLDGAKLCALAAKFEEWKEANLHGVVVMRHGKLAFEHYFRGFDLKARNGPGIIDFNTTTTHDLRSMTKSVTALVLGVAIDRGIVADVDQSVLSFLGLRRSPHTGEGPHHHSAPAHDVDGPRLERRCALH